MLNPSVMEWFWTFSLIVLAVFTSSTISENIHFTKLLSNPIPSEDKLAECLLYIVHDSNLDEKKNVGIRVKAESVNFRHKLTDTVQRFLTLNDEILVDLASEEHGSYNINWRFYFVDSLKSLEFLVYHQREQDQDLSAERQYYLLTLPSHISNKERLLEQIFEFCFKVFIINVNVLQEDENGVVTLYTYHPFSEKSCRDTTPRIHNRFINGRFENNRTIFPPKTKNFWQCPMTVITWNDPPFVILHQNGFSGLLGNVAETLAHLMNFSLDIQITPGGRGEVFSKENLTGGFKMIEDGLADFMIGASACTKLRRTHFASTGEYYFFVIRIMFKQSKSYSSLEILHLPFDCYTWIALLILLIGKWIGGLLWRNFANGYFSHRDYSTRLLILSWLSINLILRSSYEGSIFNFIHNKPHKSLPNNLEEAMNQGYSLVAQHTNKVLLDLIPELTDKVSHFNSYIENPFDFFNRLEGNVGYIDLEENLSMFRCYKFNSQKYFFAAKPVVIAYQCTYLPKFSYLTTELNHRYLQMTVHGHINKIYTKFGSLDTLRKNKRIKGEHRDMAMNDLAGAFQLLFMLIGISLCVFLMELLSRYKRKLRIVMQFFQ